MKKILVVAPHPDDETLGCGGTLLWHKNKKDRLFWLIITGMTEKNNMSCDRIEKRKIEIEKVSSIYEFEAVYKLNLPTTLVDTIPLAEVVALIGEVINKVEPHTVYLPYPGDVHSDHRITFEAASSCVKWFRYPTIQRILAYETLSETEFGINTAYNNFCPNVFIDISRYLEEKLEIMKVFSSEMGCFPFPRSEEAIRALAKFRGAAGGFLSAEAFMLLKERVDDE